MFPIWTPEGNRDSSGHIPGFLWSYIRDFSGRVPGFLWSCSGISLVVSSLYN